MMNSASSPRKLPSCTLKMCSAVADSNRILLLYALLESDHGQRAGESELGISQPAAFSPPKILREHGLVSTSRMGKALSILSKIHASSRRWIHCAWSCTMRSSTEPASDKSDASATEDERDDICNGTVMSSDQTIAWSLGVHDDKGAQGKGDQRYSSCLPHVSCQNQHRISQEVRKREQHGDRNDRKERLRVRCRGRPRL